METSTVDQQIFLDGVQTARQLMNQGDIERGVNTYEELINKLIVSSSEVSTRTATALDHGQGVDEILSKVEKCIEMPEQPAEWDNVIGHKEAKQSLDEAVVWPFQYPKYFENRTSWNGVLLYGPPGVAKTQLARTAAFISEAILFNARGSDIKSMWHGQSEKFVRCLFERARKETRAVIFLDEIDSLCQKRKPKDHSGMEGILTEFLQEMGNKTLKNGLVVIASTNMPGVLDDAIIRRFDKRIYVGLPSNLDRVEIFKLYLNGINHTMTTKCFNKFGTLTEGFSGSDIENICKDVKLQPLRRPGLRINEEEAMRALVTKTDVINSIKSCRATVSQDIMEEIAEFRGQNAESTGSSFKWGVFPVLKGIRNALLRILS